jgi:hypothetical protein
LWTLANCFEGNTFTTSAPLDLETLAPCGTPLSKDAGDWTAGDLNVITWLIDAETAPPSVDWKTANLPAIPVLDSMPDAATAPGVPASATPPTIDLDAITVPDKID